ncbi:MAG TPA: hypothetical protein VH575_22365 [Gemmataceae bacterium]|jgi:hypothetical protein
MNEDRAISENEETRPAPPSDWNKPLLLAALGLVLMLGGYAAMNYVPPHPLAELREMAARSGTAAEGLEERLKQVAPSWTEPPYRIPGRLAIFGGLVLFVAAGVRMYRSTPTTRKETDEAE